MDELKRCGWTASSVDDERQKNKREDRDLSAAVVRAAIVGMNQDFMAGIDMFYKDREVDMGVVWQEADELATRKSHRIWKELSGKIQFLPSIGECNEMCSCTHVDLHILDEIAE